jgi:hypothetical protein
MRLDPDAEQTEVIAPDSSVTSSQRFTGDPALALPVHILPFVGANQARGRRLGAIGKLGTALFASPERHGRRHSGSRDAYYNMKKLRQGQAYLQCAAEAARLPVLWKLA